MIVLYVIAGICCLISLALWAWLLKRIATGNSLLIQQPQDLVPWGLLDVYLIFAISFFLVPMFFATLAGILQEPSGSAAILAESGVEPNDHHPPGPDLAKKSLLQVAARVASFVLAVGYLVIRHRSGSSALGFSLAHFGKNVRLGIVGFFLVVPPVIALQSLLTMWVPYEHPTMEALTADRTPIALMAVLLSAGVVTPMFEEFFFRVIVQGFLQRWAVIGQRSLGLVLLGGRTTEQLSTEPGRSTPLWPIFASAAIFALMHFGQGPAPIPLYFLAIGLGYFYWRTHSAIPGIVIHLLLNVWSLIFLAVQNTTASLN